MHAFEAQPRSRNRLILALLATTTAAALLGACSQTGAPFGGSNLATEEMDGMGAVAATQKWAEAYAKRPNDPKIAMGYAKALKALGSKDKALEILTASYRANQDDGELAAELGRVALDGGRMDIAEHTLKVAEEKGIKDWRTLSAQGTFRAKKGNHSEAQQYFLAALEKQPDAVPVINNLALSYALDGKADKAENLLRTASANGHDAKRVRQNLALVLGLQGKFGEARQVASTDMNPAEAQANVAYLKNMLDAPTKVAAAPDDSDDSSASDWTPFADAEPAGGATPARNATAAATPQAPVQTVSAPARPAPVQAAVVRGGEAQAEPAKVVMVKPIEETTAPGASGTKASVAAPQGHPASTPKAAKPKSAPAAALSLLRADVD